MQAGNATAFLPPKSQPDTPPRAERFARPTILQRRELPTQHLVSPAACQAAELPHGQVQAGPNCSLAMPPTLQVTV